MLLNISVSNAAKLEEVLNNYYYTESTIPLRQRFGWLLDSVILHTVVKHHIRVKGFWISLGQNIFT